MSAAANGMLMSAILYILRLSFPGLPLEVFESRGFVCNRSGGGVFLSRERLVRRQLSIIHLQHPVAHVEIPLVVADDQDGLAAVPQRRQDLVVEELPELRILVGRPFVEDEDRR